MYLVLTRSGCTWCCCCHSSRLYINAVVFSFRKKTTCGLFARKIPLAVQGSPPLFTWLLSQLYYSQSKAVSYNIFYKPTQMWSVKSAVYERGQQ